MGGQWQLQAGNSPVVRLQAHHGRVGGVGGELGCLLGQHRDDAGVLVRQRPSAWRGGRRWIKARVCQGRAWGEAIRLPQAKGGWSCPGPFPSLGADAASPQMVPLKPPEILNSGVGKSWLRFPPRHRQVVAPGDTRRWGQDSRAGPGALRVASVQDKAGHPQTGKGLAGPGLEPPSPGSPQRGWAGPG